MAAIYNRASLTIVAVAGDGASYGLPGISRPRSGIQRSLKISKLFVLEEQTKSLQERLDDSEWYQRGWT
jgi:hypothetical protein